jgi:hypothetical protein
MKWYFPYLPSRIVYLSRPKLSGLGKHAGVLIEWLGGSFVVDRQSDRGLKFVSFEEFAHGRAVVAEATIEERSAVARAFERLKESLETAPGYDLFKRNCEHFARKVVFGEERSHQIEGVVLLAVLVAAIVVLGQE